MPIPKEHLQEYWKVYTTAAAVVVILGGSMTLDVRLPADERADAAMAKAVEVEELLAADWQTRSGWEQNQQAYHRQREIDDIDFRMRYLSDRINTLNQIPEYLDRDITEEEVWEMQILKDEWIQLKKRRYELSQ